MSSLTRLIYEQKRGGQAAHGQVTTTAQGGSDTGVEVTDVREPDASGSTGATTPYNHTVMTTISLEGVSADEDDDYDEGDELTFDPRKTSRRPKDRRKCRITEETATGSARVDTIGAGAGAGSAGAIGATSVDSAGSAGSVGAPAIFSPRRAIPVRVGTSVNTSFAEAAMAEPRTPSGLHPASLRRASPYLSGSYTSLSNQIPYSAPGTKNEHLSSSVTSLSNLANNFSLPANGQLITGNHLASPTVTSPAQLEPRFIVSKQKISQVLPSKSSSSLANFFSRSRRGTSSGSMSSSPVNVGNVGGTVNAGNAGNAGSAGNTGSAANAGSTGNAGTPVPRPNSRRSSSHSSQDSSTSAMTSRHSSMADLRHFFKKSLSFRSGSYGAHGGITGSGYMPGSAGGSFSSSPRVSKLSAALAGGETQFRPGYTLDQSAGGSSGSAGCSAGSAGVSHSSSDDSPINTATAGTTPARAPSVGATSIGATSIGASPAHAPLAHAAPISASPVISMPALHVSVGGNTTPEIPFRKRYTKFGDSLGQGAGGMVKLMRRVRDERVFAVKEFRERFAHESRREYQKKITSEYCIGSTLKHPNVIETVEIAYETNHMYQVMEYCDYDLFAIVMSGKMTRLEMDCCFRQVLNGVRYIHSIGLAHRDLKLDNCVVNREGIVKIIDFGSAVVFHYPFSKNLVEASGIVGSDPYLAPEVCVFSRYDPRPVDIWSCAIIYCCMLLKKFPWKVPKLSDSSFKMFASREPGVTFGELLKRVPPPPSYEEATEKSEKKSVKEAADAKKATEVKNTTEDKNPTKDTTKDSSAKDSTTDSSNVARHTSNIMGEDRLLNALPEEVRPLIGKMVKLAPACRISIDDCFSDPWLSQVQMCRVVDEKGQDSCTGELVPATNHKHTQVDQSVAHIAALQRNKNR